MAKEIAVKDNNNPTIEQLFPPTEDESRLLIGCRRGEYSASAIARAVEDCDAHVLNLNVTALTSGLADIVVDLRVNHRNAEAITRSLARYGYDVLEAKSSSIEDTERMRERAQEVLRYINI